MVTLHYPRASRTTVALINAFPLTSGMYDTAADELIRIAPHLDVVLVDLPGFANDGYIVTQWTFADAMRSLHHKLTSRGVSKPFIGGTSMGGYAALAYYKLFPNEVGGLILSNTKAEADSEEAKQNRETRAKHFETNGAAPKDFLNDETQKTNPAFFQWLESDLTSVSPDAIAAALRAMARRDDSTELLTRINVPTLIITSKKDEFIPPSASKVMAEQIPNSRLVEINCTGHITPLEVPAEWAKAVADFIT